MDPAGRPVPLGRPLALVLPGTTPLGVVPPRVAVPRGDPGDPVDPAVVPEPPAGPPGTDPPADCVVVLDGRAATTSWAARTGVVPVPGP
ncbi:MAG: hypothetical protein JWR20_2762, partial [Marmoricola sp.]|nr:hypothetical protein [Marmoricola sp.]